MQKTKTPDENIGITALVAKLGTPYSGSPYGFVSGNGMKQRPTRSGGRMRGFPSCDEDR